MKTTLILITLSVLLIILAFLIISGFRRKERKGKQYKGVQSGDGKNVIPNPELLQMAMSDNYKIIHPDGSYESVIVQMFKPTLANHVNKIVAAERDFTLAQGLKIVFEKINDIQKVIELKTVQCLNDGLCHSGGFFLLSGTFINITCCNCSLQEIKGKFESQLGPYKEVLNMHILNTESKGGHFFIHIFYCFSIDNCGITLCYIDLDTKKYIYPQELMEDVFVNKVKFDREEFVDNYTYHIYTAPSKEEAISFLEENPVNQSLFYRVVETPEGNFCCDIDGFYKE